MLWNSFWNFETRGTRKMAYPLSWLELVKSQVPKSTSHHKKTSKTALLFDEDWKQSIDKNNTLLTYGL
jgi:hypothetical protein